MNSKGLTDPSQYFGHRRLMSAPVTPVISCAVALIALTMGGLPGSTKPAQAWPGMPARRQARSTGSTAAPSAPQRIDAQTKRLPRGIRCLLVAYSHFLCGADSNHLIWCDGTKMRYDDGRAKTPAQQLDQPDLQDQMAKRYPPGGPCDQSPPAGQDPGRVRYAPLFMKMYGATKRQVKAHLRRVHWTASRRPAALLFTSVNGASRHLERVSKRLARLPTSVRRVLARRPSTFTWRRIKGTKRLSPHSFGIAIDVAVARSHYWRWDLHGPLRRLRYRHRMPARIVRIFESEGFIWGGRWHHYDTMHFEYRPELLACSAH
ncbi:MAG: M15 family metallopeptidase [Deltaproteobacteria bacterium]|nr:M15 family metallopeptidase [Deltaproteobacteria bacterium]